MIPVLPLVGAGFVGLALWGALRRRRRLRSGPETNWRNPNAIAMDESGSWDPDTTMSTSSERPIFRNTEGIL